MALRNACFRCHSCYGEIAIIAISKDPWLLLTRGLSERAADDDWRDLRSGGMSDRRIRIG